MPAPGPAAAPPAPATPACPAPSGSPGTPPPAAARRPGLVDGIDQRLLAELEHDGRASVRDLAARVHISRANAYARVRRLVEDGVIERFTTQVSPEHVGLTTSAYVSLRVQQNAWREMRDQLRSIPGVEHVALCSGDFDVVVLVRTTDTASLRDLVLDDIRSIPGVVDSRTVLLLDEVRGPGVRLPDAPTLD